MVHSFSDETRRISSRPMDKNLFLVFLLMLTWSENGQGLSVRSADQGEDQKTVYISPEILQHPPEEVAYKVGEPVSLPCRATGDPVPTYRWEKDGDRLEESEHPGINFTTEDGGYNLQIDAADEDYDGYYKCFASNSYGTAVSTKSRLVKAVLDTFLSKDVQVRSVDVGQPLILSCNPPKSFPTAVVYWGTKGSSEKLRPIETDARITLDYSGNLYFAHVNASDARNGRRYVCLAHNMRLRELVQGDENIIEPNNVDMVGVAPKLVWNSADPTGHVIGIKGQTVKMKCIFSGYPTPKVSFTRVGGVMGRHMTSPEWSHGQELVIDFVSPEDEGQYRCTATNSATETPVSRDFRLTVESAPYWQTEPPQNQNIKEGEHAEFSCLVEGSPTPTVSWLINGKPVEDLPANPRRSVTEYSMTYMNVTSEDAQVIQCNVTNKHGGLFSNAYLIVRYSTNSWFRSNDYYMNCFDFRDDMSSAIWFILLFIVLPISILIIVIIVIARIIYRRRGRWCPVLAEEKEKDPQTKIAADEKPFSEYSAPSLPSTSGSNGSLDSKSGGGDTDMDSLLGEYEESEETKFNEDKSFIGLHKGSVRSLESVDTGYVEAEGPAQGGPPFRAHNAFV